MRLPDRLYKYQPFTAQTLVNLKRRILSFAQPGAFGLQTPKNLLQSDSSTQTLIQVGPTKGKDSVSQHAGESIHRLKAIPEYARLTRIRTSEYRCTIENIEMPLPASQESTGPAAERSMSTMQVNHPAPSRRSVNSPQP